MFLYVNKQNEQRNLLFSNFKMLIKNLVQIEGGTYVFSLLNPDSSGKYDLVMEFIKEQVSGNRFVKGFLIENPKNISYFRSIESDPLFGLMALTGSRNTYNGKKLHIQTFFSDSYLVNGYIPLAGDVPTTLLDNYDELTRRLQKFFAPISSVPEPQEQAPPSPWAPFGPSAPQ
jgi:hypothetical protein